MVVLYPSFFKGDGSKNKKIKKKKRKEKTNKKIKRLLRKGQKPYLDCYQRHTQGLVRDGVAALILIFLAFVTSKTDSQCYFNIFIVCE